MPIKSTEIAIELINDLGISANPSQSAIDLAMAVYIEMFKKHGSPERILAILEGKSSTGRTLREVTLVDLPEKHIVSIRPPEDNKQVIVFGENGVLMHQGSLDMLDAKAFVYCEPEFPNNLYEEIECRLQKRE